MTEPTPDRVPRPGARGGAGTGASRRSHAGKAAGPSDGRERRDGRTRLLDAAERLLDEQGIDGPSARTIATAAGHGNTAAVLYHFGSREALVEAVLTRRAAEVEARRQTAVDELLAAGDADTRAALWALVSPLADMLATVEGRRFLRVLHQATTHPAYFSKITWNFGPQAARLAPLLLPAAAHLEPQQRAQRAHTMLVSTVAALASQARLIDTATPPRAVLPPEQFLDDLLDVLLAIFSA
jgi:AcrR family transcriptional regulator